MVERLRLGPSWQRERARERGVGSGVARVGARVWREGVWLGLGLGTRVGVARWARVRNQVGPAR